MLYIRNYIFFFIFFILLNLTVIDGIEPFYNLVSLLVPFHLEYGYLIGIRFLLTLSLCFVLLNYINKCINEQFNMFNFILTRVNIRKSIFKLTTYTLRKIVIILSIKLIVDLIFSQMRGFENINLFLLITFSTLVTCIIWAEMIFLLHLYQYPPNIIYLTLIFVTTISILFGNSIETLTLFVPATINLLKNPFIWITAKLFLLFGLFFLKYLRLRNFEYLGDNDHD